MRRATDDELMNWAERPPGVSARAASTEGPVERRRGEVAEGPYLSSRTVASIEAESVSWLWPGRIPAGKLVVLDGDPGLGKSTVALDLAARVTTGSPMPGESSRGAPGAVVVLSAEDGPADTIRPRLEAAGADLELVHLAENVADRDDERPVSLADTALIGELVGRTSARLIIVDPLMAYLPADANAHRDQDVRRVLRPLAEMASSTGAAVLVVRHLNKSTGGSAIYRGGGSIGVIGAARVGLLVALDPDDPTRRLVAGTKSNLGPMPETLAYRLASDSERGCAQVRWEGTSTRTADELTAGHSESGGLLADAQSWLADVLSAGPQPSQDVERMANEEGIKSATLKRAKKALGVVAEKSTGAFAGRWVVRLPHGIQPAHEVAQPPPHEPDDPLEPLGADLGLCADEPGSLHEVAHLSKLSLFVGSTLSDAEMLATLEPVAESGGLDVEDATW